MHLGMAGRFMVDARAARRSTPGEFYDETGRRPARTTTSCSTSRTAPVTYNDARRFGFMDLVAARRARRPAAISREWASSRSATSSPASHRARCSRARRAPLKAALLDQRLIAGLGNIYVCEALLPRRPSSRGRGGRRSRRRSGKPTRKAHLLAEVDPRRAQRGGRGGRLDAARPCAGRRLARLFPAPLPRLRPRRRTLRESPAAAGNVRRTRAGGPLDLLLRAMPALIEGLSPARPWAGPRPSLRKAGCRPKPA